MGEKESNRKKEKDYRAMIKARAEQAKNLRQKVELEKEKEEKKD